MPASELARREDDVASMRRMHCVCTDFEAAWLAGLRPSIEQFLNTATGLPRQDLLAALLASELELRGDRGERPSLDEYRRRFPDDAAVVERLFCVERESRAVMDTERVHPWRRASSVAGCGPIARITSGVGSGSTLHDAKSTDARATSPTYLIGKYEILGEIARGGMGVVYRARHADLDRVVALKVILAGHFASPVDIERFHTEAQAVARLDHPGVVSVFEVGEHAGHHYLAMPLIEGVSLAELAADGPIDPRRAAELIRQIAEAVHYAHDRGVIHRDLKPRNVLIDTSGRPRVTDFGLAKFVSERQPEITTQSRPSSDDRNLTLTGQVVGTPSYMAPEQASGQVHHLGRATDVYSLGAILYELLTGRPPFRGATPVETLNQVLSSEPVAISRMRPNTPHDVGTICLKCLEKEPKNRYATAAALADDLDRFLTYRPILARRSSLAEQTWRWCRRNPRVAVLIGAVAWLLVAVTVISSVSAVWLRSERDAAREAEQKATAAELAQREELYRAYLSDARATFQTGRQGQRIHGLEAIRKIIAAIPSNELTDDKKVELRDEAISLLAVSDLREVARWPYSEAAGVIALDDALDTIATSAVPGSGTMIRRMSDSSFRIDLAIDGADQTTHRTERAFSPSGRWLAETRFKADKNDERQLVVWDWRKAEIIFREPNIGKSRVAFHPNDRHILFERGGTGLLTIANIETGQVARFRSASRP
jgi:serine/threonine protein kinase